MRPYRIIATVSGAAAVVAIAGAIFLAAVPGWAQAVFLGVASGLTVWAIAGSVGLVTLTTWHGESRAALTDKIAGIRQEVERRRRSA